MSYNPLNKKDKRCGKCGVRKLVAEFKVREASTDGFEGWCMPCVNMAKKMRYTPKKERKACEICGVPTTAEEGMCSKCGKEALLEFGSMIHNYSAQTKPKADQLKYYEEAYASAYSVETRLRFKRIVEAMRKVMYGEEAQTTQLHEAGKGRAGNNGIRGRDGREVECVREDQAGHVWVGRFGGSAQSEPSQHPATHVHSMHVSPEHQLAN